VKQVGFGKFHHFRALTPLDKQEVVAINRDTLYSHGVFDLDDGPATVILPDPGNRFMSLQAVTHDHYSPATSCASPRITLTRAQVRPRYVALTVRALVNPTDHAGKREANALQDQIRIEQTSGPGKWTVPSWGPIMQTQVRDHLAGLMKLGGCNGAVKMGTKEAVDPVCHLLASATGWGLNASQDAVYDAIYPKTNDGRTVHKLAMKGVPLDGFWSISVYNEKGYFEKNDFESWSPNNLTARLRPDGSFTIQFGGCTQTTLNYLVTPSGWNYVVRQYRPRKAILDGRWKFPESKLVR
jgi:hypothetical protein